MDRQEVTRGVNSHDARIHDVAVHAAQYGMRRGRLLGQEAVDRAAIFRLDREFSLVTNGRLSDAELIEDCVAGWGTDEEGIERIIGGLTKEHASHLQADYGRRYQR